MNYLTAQVRRPSIVRFTLELKTLELANLISVTVTKSKVLRNAFFFYKLSHGLAKLNFELTPAFPPTTISASQCLIFIQEKG
ncbi:hypothetical protein CHS0354_013226 [Potamilus streckersoni]|uniref:Uncharacterized protein n=1 Tax=Potamilus streckersoni TaxID=2493646 RepID=A0AAE0SQX3_9BIVA|nr:hypothetical protein CHS0354_013226 [Potamilus streckersoni]